MSTHQQVVEILGAYALDALEPDEADMVQAHVADCPICQAELASFAQVAGRLADLSPSRQPAPDLRGRVLAAVEGEAYRQPSTARRISRRLPSLRWLAAAAAVVLLSSQVWVLSELASMRALLSQQQQIQTILLSSDEAPIKLQSPDANSQAQGSFRSESELHWGLLNYYKLPPPGAGQFYQCWFEFATGPALPCGRLPLDANGHGLLLVTLPDPAPVRIRVTLESGPTSTPTGPTVLESQTE